MGGMRCPISIKSLLWRLAAMKVTRSSTLRSGRLASRSPYTPVTVITEMCKMSIENNKESQSFKLPGTSQEFRFGFSFVRWAAPRHLDLVIKANHLSVDIPC